MKKKKPALKKSLNKKSIRMADLAKDIWPQERDFFERPERYRYVRKLIPSDGCVFCACEKGGVGVEQLCLYRGSKTLVVMNKYPYNTGHLLILPRRHVGNIWELTEAENAEVAGWIQKATKILKDVYNCDGFNIGLNHGAVAGAGIPQHLHWHLIPRWTGDTNFFPLIAETKALPETLEQTYNKLQTHFA